MATVSEGGWNRAAVFLLLDTELCPHRPFTSEPLPLVCALEKHSCPALGLQPLLYGGTGAFQDAEKDGL